MHNVPDTEEIWCSIPGSSNLLVSNYGRVYNDRHEREITPTKNTAGHPKISFTKYGIETSCTIRRLVALAFVPGKTRDFDTAMLLDNDKTNLHAANIVWRPRWFVMKYVDQFTQPKHVYETGRIYEETDHENIIYNSIWEASLTHGLLAGDILYSTLFGKEVFPSWQIFNKHKV